MVLGPIVSRPRIGVDGTYYGAICGYSVNLPSQPSIQVDITLFGATSAPLLCAF